jgi:hypothetical protein
MWWFLRSLVACPIGISGQSSLHNRRISKAVYSEYEALIFSYSKTDINQCRCLLSRRYPKTTMKSDTPFCGRKFQPLHSKCRSQPLTSVHSLSYLEISISWKFGFSPGTDIIISRINSRGTAFKAVQPKRKLSTVHLNNGITFTDPWEREREGDKEASVWSRNRSLA